MENNFLEVLNTTDPNRFNCVKYARARYPKLPFGLWTLKSKRKIINSQKAKKDCVAIINAGIFGHLGIIKKTYANGHITIKEANYKTGKITKRHGTETDLKILGYFI